MKLFEVCTGRIGESYERAYAWAETKNDAKALFQERHDGREIRSVRELMNSADRQFVTQLTDHGWPD